MISMPFSQSCLPAFTWKCCWIPAIPGQELARLLACRGNMPSNSGFSIPPVDILCRQADEDDLKLQKIGRADNPQTHVLFSGCKDNQTSAEAYISVAYNGAFTYYFCKTLSSRSLL
jgi:hypothetical protein